MASLNSFAASEKSHKDVEARTLGFLLSEPPSDCTDATHTHSEDGLDYLLCVLSRCVRAAALAGHTEAPDESILAGLRGQLSAAGEALTQDVIQEPSLDV